MSKKRTKSQRGRTAKSKGSKFERDVAKILTKWWDQGDFHRTPASGALHWKDDKRVSGDIVPPEGSDFPFSVECKNHENWIIDNIVTFTGEIPSFWNQCSSDAKKFNKIPMLIMKRNFIKPWVIVPYRKALFTELVSLNQPVFDTFFYKNSVLNNSIFVLSTQIQSLVQIDKHKMLNWYTKLIRSSI